MTRNYHTVVKPQNFYKMAAFVLLFSQSVFAQNESEAPKKEKDLMEMSLEELLEVEVPIGSLVNLKQYSKPVAITVITKDDIRVSASRNMLDLLETYVPGFFWLDHQSEGMAAAMRGISSNRNLKFLLLVNGVVVNNRAHKGMVSEISNWDLDDIEKIEVVRGPGSVTYGPGAIAGVISITTKRAMEESVVGASVNYKSEYQSRGLNLYAGGKSTSGVKSLFYGSIQSTDGINHPEVFTAKSFTDYGLPDQMKTPVPINPYMRDALNIPQLKLMADFDFGKGYKFFTRYNQAGAFGNPFERYRPLSSFNVTSNKPVYKGDAIPSMYSRNQQFLAIAEKKFTLNDRLELSTNIVYDNENNYSIRYQTLSTLTNTNLDSLKLRELTSIMNLSSLRHAIYQYSERQITGKAVLTYKSANNKFQGAFGTELTNNHWAAPWFKSASAIRLGDQREIVSDSTVLAVSNTGVGASANQITANQGVYVGNGWQTNTISFYGEGSYVLTDKISLLASARTDKDTYSKWLFSPRLAVLFDFYKHTFRVVGLQSTRMNTASQMLVEHRAGRVSPTEKLRALEVLYTYVHSPKLITEANVYYNSTEILDWSTSTLGVVALGKSQTAGAEIAVTYKANNLSVGFNHAIVGLVDWKLNADQVGSGISYSDYNQPIAFTNNGVRDTVYIKGTGKKLSNYAQNITKLFATYTLLDQKLTLHLDTRILWNFAGSDDGLSAYQNAVSDVPSGFGQQVRDFVSSTRANNIYKTDLRCNASVAYKIYNNLQISAYCNNLFYTNKARRYFYDSGFNASNPSKLRYTQEPRFVGLKLAYEL
ncbi:TonB dependent receptor [Flexibacter flexilis DSM 6793]|uniref:TonB dependent receptor n=1 Tax=Flexibacter flexilis DSM 6793 TaxID=927664 RepID=A0A1I1D8P5_9BACT|nr:TonB-dependent receptor plug domain-containing protein [Flexibacter flexilis]SFB70706.1 TonB dependent receptor [Flexibacter flexilis DSM 6793]